MSISSVRQAIIDRLFSLGDYMTGDGYDQATPRLDVPGDPAGPYAWCAKTYSWVTMVDNDHLPSMQDGVQVGFIGVMAGAQWSNSHGFLRSSTSAEVGDGICFGWQGRGLSNDWGLCHIETAIPSPGNPSSPIDASGLWTRGGNSGPRGGMNTHCWVPGGSLIIGAINSENVLKLTAPFPTPVVVPANKPKNDDSSAQPIVPGWYRQNAGPMGYGAGDTPRTGGDVDVAGEFLTAHMKMGAPSGPHYVYDAHMQQFVKEFQRQQGLQSDGYLGIMTAAAMRKLGAK